MKVFFEKIKKYRSNKGMTYVELIVVLSIFSLFSGVAIFNYKGFQGKVDIKNLANEMTLQIVEAQKSALNGKLPPPSQQPTDPINWKPSYGIYFDKNTNNKIFYYFVDLNQNMELSVPFNNCPGFECLDKINITRGNYISDINSCVGISCGTSTSIDGPLSITFTRPNSGAVFFTNQIITPDYIRITLSSPNSISTYIKIFPSGRVELSDDE